MMLKKGESDSDLFLLDPGMGRSLWVIWWCGNGLLTRM